MTLRLKLKSSKIFFKIKIKLLKSQFQDLKCILLELSNCRQYLVLQGSNVFVFCLVFNTHIELQKDDRVTQFCMYLPTVKSSMICLLHITSRMMIRIYCIIALNYVCSNSNSVRSQYFFESFKPVYVIELSLKSIFRK